MFHLDDKNKSFCRCFCRKKLIRDIPGSAPKPWAAITLAPGNRILGLTTPNWSYRCQEGYAKSLANSVMRDTRFFHLKGEKTTYNLVAFCSLIARAPILLFKQKGFPSHFGEDERLDADGEKIENDRPL